MDASNDGCGKLDCTCQHCEIGPWSSSTRFEGPSRDHHCKKVHVVSKELQKVGSISGLSIMVRKHATLYSNLDSSSLQLCLLLRLQEHCCHYFISLKCCSNEEFNYKLEGTQAPPKIIYMSPLIPTFEQDHLSKIYLQ